MAPAIIDSETVNGTYATKDSSVSQRTPKCPPLDDIKVVMVTGGAGFIASWMVSKLAALYKGSYHVVCFDSLEVCASLKNVEGVQKNSNFSFVEGDIRSFDAVTSCVKHYNVDAIIHFAALSHVDTSFLSPIDFSRTNVIGTHNLLEAARLHDIKRFVHISTDEVYGEILPGGRDHVEADPLHPTNPYSASKAAAEMLVAAYFKSFNIPAVIVRSNNIYGPRQFPEKLIPKFIMLFLRGEQVPLYGHGKYTRRYVYATDAVNAINVIFHRGVAGQTYNIGTEDEVSNWTLCGMLHDIIRPNRPQGDLKASIRPTADRPYHDRRYGVDFAKLTKLGWVQEVFFEEGLRKTVSWYRTHGETWWDNLEAALGTSSPPTASPAPLAPIPFNKALVIGKELEYLQKTYEHGDIKGAGNSPFVSRCQKWIAESTGTTNKSEAYCTTSGTAALEFAAMLADIQPGDEIIMPSYTYVSTMNAFALRGGVSVFVDIDKRTMNIDESLIEAAITPKTRAIVPVHYSSFPCDMDRIMAIANKHNLLVIEDAACCLSTYYKGKALGAIGHIGCFSFHATKPFTAGGQGGAILVNDPSLFRRAEIIYENGTDRRQFGRGEIKSYTVQDIGSNFQMSETAAASLWAQLERADDVVERRSKICHTYEKRLKPLADAGRVELPVLPETLTRFNGGQYWLLCKDEKQRRRFMAHMRDAGIETQFHFQPLHESPFGRKTGRYAGALSGVLATECSLRIVRLPVFYAMRDSEVEHVVKRVLDFFATEDPAAKNESTVVEQAVGQANGKDGMNATDEGPIKTNETTEQNGKNETNGTTHKDGKSDTNGNNPGQKPLPFELTDLDKETLLLTDEQYVPDDWEAVRTIINAGRLMDFRRYPSHLKRYITWTVATKAKYGDMTNYICTRRLHWEPLAVPTNGSSFAFKNSTAFADPADYKILFNDWPYGVTKDIVHLVVWSKTPVPVKPETGEVTEKGRALIERFVNEKFRKPLEARGQGTDTVLWFKNWTKLQSMRAVEHFHVLVRNADPDLLREWTDGDEKDESVLQD